MPVKDVDVRMERLGKKKDPLQKHLADVTTGGILYRKKKKERSFILRYFLKNLQPTISTLGAMWGVVYDPFLGSGTTAKMAVRYHRHFIGSEISKEYFDIAQRRIADELRQPSLF